MRTTLRLTLTRAGSERAVDVSVEADPGDTAADLAPALAAAWVAAGAGASDPPPPDTRLLVDGRVVDAATIVGRPPLLDGACVRLGGAVLPEPRRRDPAAALRLDVVAGPDAGHSHPLTPGRHVVGRDAACDLTIDDPGLSRRQAVVEVSADGLRVEDLGSTNGTLLAGAPVHRAGLAPGAELVLGESRLVVRPAADTPPLARTATGDGTWTVHRSPALPGRPHGASFELPRPPLDPVPVRIPWLGMLLPLPVCALLALLWGPQLLAFALLGPLVSGGTAWADRRSGRRRHTADTAAHAAATAAVEESVAAALAAERVGLAARSPDAAATLRTALGPTRRVWERGREDPLEVRLGIGTVTSATVVVDPVTHRPVPRLLAEAPVVLDLHTVPVLGLCGPDLSRYAVCRHLLGQLAVRVGPADLRLLVVDPAAELAWTRWLPQVTSTGSRARAEAAALVDRLDAAAAAGDRGPSHRRGAEPFTVVVLPPSVTGADLPVLESLLEHARAGTCAVIAHAPTASGLPPQCRAVVELPPCAPGPATLAMAGEAPRALRADGVGVAWGERLARALAPLRDARAVVATLPPTVGLQEALGLDLSNPQALRRAWAVLRPGLDAVVGRRADADHVVDLVADGPHALVGGTTGSGKSELLRSLVAGLAARHSPDAVTFVLVDYKGGSAFRECAALPHTAALVTDLDPHLARRALVGLTAELRRRERVLAGAGARDLAAFNAGAGPGGGLPRLVIVVDELKMLVEELPEFVEGLVRLAALGRSLGLHLVLATQRPAGAVTADVQANVNLRIALRVRDRVDSEHVIGSADAALLPDGTPGRAISSTGSGAAHTFQTAHPGAMTTTLRGVRVTPIGPGGSLPAPAGPPLASGPSPTTSAATDLARLVDTARLVADSEGTRPATAPWLPPLADGIPAPTLDAGDGSVAIGVLDDPERQAQPVWRWSPADAGVLGVIGGAGSGRSTLVRTLVAGLLRCEEPVEVYAVDAGRSLLALEPLPHVGAVVDPGDTSRLARLVTRLAEEVAARARGLHERGLTRLEEWRDADPASAPAWLLVAVDGWDALTDAAMTDHETLVTVERLRALLEEGAAAGVRAVLTGGRPLLVGAAARVCTDRVALGRLDPAEAALLGLPRPDGRPRPPGRGVRLADGLEVQVAHLGTQPAGAAQTEALAALAAARRPRARRASFTIGSLPARVLLSDLVPRRLLLAGAGDGPQGMPTRTAPDDSLLIACAEDGLAVGFSPSVDGRRLLVVGPRGSGRSTSLAALAARCVAAGRPAVAVAVHPGTVPWPGGVTTFGPHEVERLVAAHRADPQLAVLVDDADQLTGTPMDGALVELAGRVERDHGLLVCAADAAVAGTLFRGAVAEVARARTGLLLGPSGPADGDVLGVRVPRSRGRQPGRGYLVVRGATTLVQVALPVGEADGAPSLPAPALPARVPA